MKIFAVEFFTKEDVTEDSNDVTFFVRAEDYLSAVDLSEKALAEVTGRYPHVERKATFVCDLGKAYGDVSAQVLTEPMDDGLHLLEGFGASMILYRRDEPDDEWTNDNEIKNMLFGAMKDKLDVDFKRHCMTEEDAE